VLILSRNLTEAVVIEREHVPGTNRSDAVEVDTITITVLEVKGRRVKLGVDAPEGYRITREPR
jgi:sRNA-binding carbon storage regulator CsrA